ncbi:MAG: 3-dehydroquinate synthase [Acidobacteria bacterium]|nr:3-dehydroquinate synthase [Acidobacteriota bacterium]
MAVFSVRTAACEYPCIVERGALRHIAPHLPRKAGKIFVVTTEDVWKPHGYLLTGPLAAAGKTAEVLLFPGGEERKRLASVEALADQMLALGADRSSLVIAFGGGIVGDLGGFLAAIFMRGIPVIQVPTTLLAQVDASVGGKTGANLAGGKNLIGAFHQPRAVLIDPDVLATLSEREYRAGLFEVVKYGIVNSPALFDRLEREADKVLAREPEVLEYIIGESVRIKAEVVTEDEKEGDLRRILNFGHTIGHALEAETGYARLLHGEAVSFGMRAVVHLSHQLDLVNDAGHRRILDCIGAYGAIPSLDGIRAENLVRRVASDKKTIQGKVHFVLTEGVGKWRISADVDGWQAQEATARALEDLRA